MKVIFCTFVKLLSLKLQTKAYDSKIFTSSPCRLRESVITAHSSLSLNFSSRWHFLQWCENNDHNSTSSRQFKIHFGYQHVHSNFQEQVFQTAFILMQHPDLLQKFIHAAVSPLKLYYKKWIMNVVFFSKKYTFKDDSESF